MKKQLIIVADDAYLKYATYLQGLVSSADDEEGKQVGTKDGSVSVVIWDEAHHKANAKSLSSGNHVVFFGDSDYAKKNCAEIETKFSEFGMEYGWLGNHANLRVIRDSLNKDNAPGFYDMADAYGKKFENELSFMFSPKRDEELGNEPADHAIAVVEAVFPPAHIAELVISKAKSSKLAEQLSMAASKGIDMTKGSEARDQQYTLLTLAFYLDGLSEFLGM